MNNINQIVDSIPPKITHVIGASSGATGLALWAELAKHFTAIGGLVVMILSILGSGFYALYWAIKFFREKSNK